MIGSSPLARGLLRRTQYCHFCGRIIPACAGFTCNPIFALLPPQDHPRLRGVYRSGRSATCACFGSSPLARGLREAPVVGAPVGGIIPACAGFTVEQLEPSKVDAGSSPLARGLPVSLTWDATRQGIIPACAGFTGTLSGTDSGTPDHPRLRGVYADAWIIHAAWAGSSPLARGLPEDRGRAGADRGIIPACAGFTQGHRADAPGPPDHPRLRGVYQAYVLPGRPLLGSSPLARGLRRGGSEGRGMSGIIPACAGFTRRPVRIRDQVEDHPRSRGVYGGIQRTWSSAWGSSPLARGLREREEYEEGGFGIIPARAGFTTHWTRRSGPTWDHPRSRGVYPVMSMRRTASSGSSPLARGLLPLMRVCYSPMQDHPRSRGVYVIKAFADASWLGSSPLARGLPTGPGPLEGLPRIIPARAGFTVPLRDQVRPPQDHPRSRGVYLEPEVLDDGPAGSSPLARGLHDSPGPYRPLPRIIPARAGFTTRS